MLPALSRGEKAQILKRVVRDLLMTISPVSTRGRMCAAVSLVSFEPGFPFWLLEQARRLGASE